MKTMPMAKSDAWLCPLLVQLRVDSCKSKVAVIGGQGVCALAVAPVGKQTLHSRALLRLKNRNLDPIAKTWRQLAAVGVRRLAF